MPVGYRVGDHRMFVVDLVKESLVGAQPQAIMRPRARRLNRKIPECLHNYNKQLEHMIDQHRLREKLQDCLDPKLTEAERTVKLDKVDAEAKQYMLHVEKLCRKIKCGRIPNHLRPPYGSRGLNFIDPCSDSTMGKGRTKET